MSATTPSSLLSDSLTGLGLSTNTLFFALNYTFKPTEATGIKKRLRQNKGDIDIDIACVLYKDNGTISDLVWFKQLRDKAESVRHQGDSLNGRDRGNQTLYEAPLDQEQIRLYLNRIPAHISSMALIAHSYYGQPLGKVGAGEVHLSDDEGNRAFDVNLKQLPRDCHAVWIASLHREVDDWHVVLQNLPLAAKDLMIAAQLVAHELARALPAS